jgi:glycine hydroxymethyltransferase
LFNNEDLSAFDSQIANAIANELQRQEDHLELIASENYASQRVMAVQGSVLTNKYAEGYAHKRYYGGCEFVDVAEDLAVARAKQLFGADYVNVQPHSGSSANAEVLQALMEPGEVLLGMGLDQGGHLTHGSKVSFSGKLYESYSYGLDPETGDIDYQQVADLAKQHRPKVIIAGFSAYSQIINWQKFRDIADSCGAYLLADMAHVAGLVAVGLYPSPVAIADVTTSTTHKTLRGPRGGIILAKSNPELEKKLSSAVFPGCQGGPLMHVIAAKAVAFLEALQPEFKVYQQQVLLNAKALAGQLQSRGFTLVSGGTENHLLMVNLVDKNITGKQAEQALGEANITTNKNTVPNDPQSPFVTSGLRLGTPAITTRGFGESQCRQVGDWIADVLDNIDDPQVIGHVKESVLEICARYRVYGSLAS